MEVIRVHDPDRQPTDWSGHIRPGQFVAFEVFDHQGRSLPPLLVVVDARSPAGFAALVTTEKRRQRSSLFSAVTPPSRSLPEWQRDSLNDQISVISVSLRLPKAVKRA